MEGVSTPSRSKNQVVPKNRDGYSLLRRIAEFEGIYNSGIYTAREDATGELAVCKFTVPVTGENAKREAGILYRLRNHANISQIYKHSIVYPENRIYIEYCSGGTLKALMSAYKAEARRIPEPFIWHVAESMMRALCFMHLGIPHETGNLTPPRSWDPIYHYDLHICNVMIASSYSPDYIYPRVVLVDFGHSRTGDAIKDPRENERCRGRDLLSFAAIILSLVKVGQNSGEAISCSPELKSLMFRCQGMVVNDQIKPSPLADELLRGILRARPAVMARMALEPLMRDFCTQ